MHWMYCFLEHHQSIYHILLPGPIKCFDASSHQILAKKCLPKRVIATRLTSRQKCVNPVYMMWVWTMNIYKGHAFRKHILVKSWGTLRRHCKGAYFIQIHCIKGEHLTLDNLMDQGYTHLWRVLNRFLPNNLSPSSQPPLSPSPRRTTPYSPSSATSWTWSTSWKEGSGRWDANQHHLFHKSHHY